MDEKTLYSLRREPDPVFKKNLKSRLDAIENSKQKGGDINRGLRLALSILGILAIIMFSIFAVPGVKASVIQFINRIGGVNFTFNANLPNPDDVTTVQPSLMSFDQALKVTKIQLTLPQTLPATYKFDLDEVQVYSGERALDGVELIDLQAKDQEGGLIRLTIFPDGEKINTLVGEGSTVEITLPGGEKVALTNGGWSAVTKKWDAALPYYSIAWMENQNLYLLAGADLETLIDFASAFFQ